MKVCFDANYPAGLIHALRIVHTMPYAPATEIIQTPTLTREEINDAVIFLFDYKRKGMDAKTEFHFTSGCKVFVFKLRRKEKINLFEMCLATLRLWSSILDMAAKSEPFVYAFSYGSKKLKKVA